ncbi:MAG: Ig-like domain-containing protein [Desulfobacterales bacterium]
MKAKSVIMSRGQWIIVLMIFCLLSLQFGCSSGGGGGSDSGGTGVAQVKISTADTTKTASANGEESYTITAQVLNSSGVAMGDQPITFTAIGSKGLVAFTPATQGSTGADGTFTATVTDICSEDDFFIVRAASGGKSAEMEVRFFATPVARYLGLSLSQTTVKSDNSNSTEITASVLDANRAPIEDITVAFQTIAEGSLSGGGQISSSTASTDENGDAVIEFRSGTVDKKNQTVTIEAWIPAFPEQDGIRKLIPVQVVGSSVSLSAEKSNLVIDPANSDRASTQVTITVRDAGGSPINDAQVDVEVEEGAKGDVIILPSSGRTNVHGNFVATVTGAASGTVSVLAMSMGAQASQVFSVGKVGETFGIETPMDDTVRITTQECLEIKVRAPNTQQVRLATSLGAFVDSGCCTCGKESEFCDYRPGCGSGQKTLVANVDVNAMATVYLRSENPGIANIEVMDITNPAIKDTLTVAVVETVDMATQLSLQASATVVAPSSGTTQNTVALTVMVRNAGDQPVSGAPVAFSLLNPTGGGERVSPVIVFTDESGKATSTFTSGSLNSGSSGVTVKAEMIRNAGETEISDTVAIIIGGTAASIEFGRGTTVESISNDTMYSLPMSLIVTDSNGNPISGAVVTLGAWPNRYATGYWEGTDECFIVYTGWHENEDINRNLILDPEEDKNEDGQLTPPSSSAGTLPSRVTTGENGSIEFLLIYPKISAGWIEAEISASTTVLGSETKSAKTFVLPWLDGEECNLPNAPYDPPKGAVLDVGTVKLTAVETSGKKADGQDSYSITAQVLDSSGKPMTGLQIDFFASVSQGVVSIEPPGGISNANGIVNAEVKYVNNTLGGSVVVSASTGEEPDEKTANLTLSFRSIVDRVIITSNGTSGKLADGVDFYSVTAKIVDKENRPISDFPISFTATATEGTAYIDPAAELSNNNGEIIAKASFRGRDSGGVLSGGTMNVRAASEGKAASITLTFDSVDADGGQIVNEQNINPSVFTQSDISNNSLYSTESFENYETEDSEGKVSSESLELLKNGNFKIESSLWNLPGLAFGNRITQLVGYAANGAVETQLLEGLPVLFISGPGLTIKNGSVVIEPDGKAITLGQTQFEGMQQESVMQEKIIQPWEIELVEYVSHTYNSHFNGYPTSGLCNIAVCAENDGIDPGKVEENILAESTVILSGQPVILFDRESFSLANGEVESIKILVCDKNLNPLSPGTTVKITMNNGNMDGRIENTYQNANSVGPDVNEHLKLIEYRLNISDSNPQMDAEQAASINVNVLWEGITIRSRLNGIIR